MIVYKFIGHITKPWIAYTEIVSGTNIPNKIEGNPIKWEFSENIDAASPLTNFSKSWLHEIKEHGFYIPNPTIEWGQERTEKI